MAYVVAHDEEDPDRRRFEVRWTDGNRKRGKRFRTAAEADAFIVHLQESRNAGRPAIYPTATVDQVMARYTQDKLSKLARNTREATLSQYKNHIQPHLGPLEAGQLNVSRLQLFVDSLSYGGSGAQAVGVPAHEATEFVRVRKAGYQTVRRVQAVLSGIFAFAVTSQLIPGPNPARSLLLPEAPPPEDRKLLSILEIERIRVQGDLRHRAFISAGAYAGPRPGENLAIRARDVALGGLLLPRSMSHGEIRRPKTRRSHVIPLLKLARQDLARLISRLGLGPDDLLFAGPDGEPVTDSMYRNWRYRRFWPYAIKAGASWATPRDMRRAFVTYRLYAAHPIHEVAAWAGHSVETLMKHYAEVIANVNPAAPLNLSAEVAKQRVIATAWWTRESP